MNIKKLEKNVKLHIGKQYRNMVDQSDKADIQQIYKTINEVNKALFDKIPFPVVFTADDPYNSSKHMRERILDDGKVYIYNGGKATNLMNKRQNCVSRAVHDVFAHCVCGCPFSFRGEYNAYLTQRAYYPKNTWNVLFAEIPAQTAAYYHKKSFNFQQKAFSAPKEWLDLCVPLKKDYSKNAIIEKPAL